MTFRPFTALLIAAALVLSACSATGATSNGAASPAPAAPAASPAPAAAGTAPLDPRLEGIRKLAEQRLARSVDETSAGKVVSVRATPYFGLYELVTADRKVLYTDAKVDYIVSGHIYDMKTLVDVTDARLEEVTAIPLDTLPLDLAIKTVKGNGKRRMVVFSDTDCPYCRKLEDEMRNITDVTVYTFLYPIQELHPNAPEHSRRLWCALDRPQAWHDYWAKTALPEARECDVSGLAKILKVGNDNGIRATPTLVFNDGHVTPGAMPAAQIEKRLGAH